MTHSEGTAVSAASGSRRKLWLTVFLFGAKAICALLILGGSTDSSSQRSKNIEAETNLVSKIPSDQAVQPIGHMSVSEELGESSDETQQPEDQGTIYWAFRGKGSQGPVLHMPGLVKLPSCSSNENEEAQPQPTEQETEEPTVVAVEEPTDEATEEPSDEATEELDSIEEPALVAEPMKLETVSEADELPQADAAQEPIALLLPPTTLPQVSEPEVEEKPESTDVQQPLAESPTSKSPEQSLAIVAPITPTPHDLTEVERDLVEQVLRETNESITGDLTDARINEVATTKIRQANALAMRGAPFAARQKLIEVLRMISQAKDARVGSPRYSGALAAGMRALEEAKDFSPQGAELEAQLDLELVTGAHRTPLAEHLDLQQILPQQMLDRYLRYAQLKMAMSVAGKPAGSMALYALGKVTRQVEQKEGERHKLIRRQAVAFQQAALIAHNQNYLAAHELAVLLAESGHYGPAHNLFVQLVATRPNPTIYRNLARVQKRLGYTAQAKASRQMATAMNASNPQPSQSVKWVPPQHFTRSMVPTRQAVAPSAAGQNPTAQRQPAPGTQAIRIPGQPVASAQATRTPVQQPAQPRR